MTLYEYRQHSLDPTHVAWDVIEFDSEIPSYTVEHRDLTDKERADFREMFLARHVYTD